MTDLKRRLLEEAVGKPVSRETFDRLLDYEDLFRTWSARINLASQSTLATFWNRHVVDSAQLVRLAPDAKRWVDLGSGGGLPGVVVAILLKDTADSVVDLVESNGKKAAFLTTALSRAGLRPRVHRLRIEDAWQAVGPKQIVTARALAPLPLLIEYAEPWLTAGATGLFHKGRDYRQEIAKSRVTWNFDLIEHQSRVEADSRILEIGRLARNDQIMNSNRDGLGKQ